MQQTGLLEKRGIRKVLTLKDSILIRLYVFKNFPALLQQISLIEGVRIFEVTAHPTLLVDALLVLQERTTSTELEGGDDKCFSCENSREVPTFMHKMI